MGSLVSADDERTTDARDLCALTEILGPDILKHLDAVSLCRLETSARAFHTPGAGGLSACEHEAFERLGATCETNKPTGASWRRVLCTRECIERAENIVIYKPNLERSLELLEGQMQVEQALRDARAAISRRMEGRDPKDRVAVAQELLEEARARNGSSLTRPSGASDSEVH
mmetsp:Transcript_35451/g.108812  ORF Transcript_35451/g.108812 Transcript_35451/m.108812 type:complete len:172 (-) Transcript_35451:93-608(-)